MVVLEDVPTWWRFLVTFLLFFRTIATVTGYICSSWGWNVHEKTHVLDRILGSNLGVPTRLFQVPFDKRKIDVYACPMMLGSSISPAGNCHRIPLQSHLLGAEASPPQSEASHGEAGNLRLRTELPGCSGDFPISIVSWTSSHGKEDHRRNLGHSCYFAEIIWPELVPEKTSSRGSNVVGLVASPQCTYVCYHCIFW